MAFFTFDQLEQFAQKKLENPQTLEEWQEYIATLSGESLRSKTIGANSPKFIQSLQKSNYSLEEIETLMKFFVRRFAETGQKIPEDGLFDLVSLYQEDPLARELARNFGIS